MANPYELFKTDEKVEVEQGVTLDYGAFRVRIARAGGNNKKFGKLLIARMKPYRRQLDTDTMDEEVSAAILRGVYADAIVLGFDVKNEDGTYEVGIPAEDGSVKPFTRENLIKIFEDLPEFFRDVQDQANRVSLFRAAELEADVKNS